MGGSRRRSASEITLALYLVVLVLWAVAAVGCLAVVVVSQVVTGDWCTDPETSAAGRAHWSWSEMGRVCTWNGPEGTYETGPGMGNWATLIAVVAMGAALLFTGRWIRRARRSEADPTRSERPAVTVGSSRR